MLVIFALFVLTCVGSWAVQTQTAPDNSAISQTIAVPDTIVLDLAPTISSGSSSSDATQTPPSPELYNGTADSSSL